MTVYEKSLEVLEELFGKDCFFSLATAAEGRPSLRVVDTYYHGGVFWIVTYGNSRKMAEIGKNPYVALCNDFNRFEGKAYHAGHPLGEENREIREELVRVFAPWYFAHNDEGDENMCYARVEPETGFFHKEGTAYKVNFVEKTAEEISFAPGIVTPGE